jgi:hypothetical protein
MSSWYSLSKRQPLAIRAVFGWGGQRHKATNRQAELASPRNPTKKSRLTKIQFELWKAII